MLNLAIRLLGPLAILAITGSSLEAQKRQRDRISREEIMQSAQRSSDLYTVIRSLRPRFLQPPPGVRSFGNSNAPFAPLAVYVDGKKDAGVDVLRVIDPQFVQEVRYMDPDQSSAEFGPSAPNGAIIVRMVRVKPAGDTLKARPDSSNPAAGALT